MCNVHIDLNKSDVINIVARNKRALEQRENMMLCTLLYVSPYLQLPTSFLPSLNTRLFGILPHMQNCFTQTEEFLVLVVLSS